MNIKSKGASVQTEVPFFVNAKAHYPFVHTGDAPLSLHRLK